MTVETIINNRIQQINCSKLSTIVVQYNFKRQENRLSEVNEQILNTITELQMIYRSKSERIVVFH